MYDENYINNISLLFELVSRYTKVQEIYSLTEKHSEQALRTSLIFKAP